MYSFENEVEGGMRNYSDALWWTAMLLTTMGSDYFPRTAEGRMLCLILAIYGFAIFGYVTATIASFFLSRDAEETTEPSLRELKEEIAQLRQMLADRPLQG